MKKVGNQENYVKAKITQERDVLAADHTFSFSSGFDHFC